MKKLQGFANEYLYVLPSDVLNNFSFSKVIRQLYITDLGFFPQAKFHFVHREHGAKEWILIFCTHGRGTIRSATAEWQLSQGSIALLPPDKEHTYFASAENPWDIFWVHFSGDLVEEYIPQETAQNDGFMVLNHTSDDDMAMLMSQFWQMIQALSGGFSYQAVFYASQLLGTTLAYVSLHSKLPKSHYTMGNEYITQAIQYVYDHLEEKVTFSTLTKYLGVSASYLSRVFRQTVGTSVNQFIIDIKTKQASHYLQDTNLSIQQIAERLGYTDQYYFSRVFKKNFGVSPRTFRNQRRRRGSDHLQQHLPAGS